jgi:hypothetical protein
MVSVIYAFIPFSKVVVLEFEREMFALKVDEAKICYLRDSGDVAGLGGSLCV